MGFRLFQLSSGRKCHKQLPILDTKYTQILSEQWMLKAKNQTFSVMFNYSLYFHQDHIQGGRSISLSHHTSCVDLSAVKGQLLLARQPVGSSSATSGITCVSHVEVSEQSSTQCT